MEQSPNLETVDIRAWAQQIRETKIRELQELINVETVKYTSTNSIIALGNIARLNEKLVILQTK
jgi:hypothetical protein